MAFSTSLDSKNCGCSFEITRDGGLVRAVEQVAEAIAITDHSGRIEYVNPAFSRVTGFSAEEAIGQTPRLLRSGVQDPEFYANLWSTIQSGREWHGDIVNRRKDGTLYTEEMTITPIRDKDGEITRFIAVKQEVTARRIAEEAQRFLASLLQHTEDAIVGTALDGKIMTWNPAAEKLYGYSAPEAIGQPVMMTIPAEYWDDVRANFSRISSGEAIPAFEGGGVARDGRRFPISLSLSPIPGRNGRVIGVAAIIRDISAQKRAAEECLRAAAAAESANRAKGEFLANMSHELRTPMNGIVAMTELALETELSAEQREYLETVKLSADSLLRILNDILDFSKIEAGKLDLEIIDFDLNEFLREVIRLMAPIAAEKRLTLTSEVSPGVPAKLRGDPGRLRQIILNLVGNAVKFTPSGGVALRIRREGRGAGPGASDAIQMHFEVEDTGIGVPVEKQRMIFDAFAQADGSMRRRFGGTGLGLSISARLVHMMGGKIWVESTAGLGSVFHFTACLGTSPSDWGVLQGSESADRTVERPPVFEFTGRSWSGLGCPSGRL